MLGFSAALIAHGRAEPHRELFMHYILPVLGPPGPAAAPPSLSSPVALALFFQGGRKQESFDGRKRRRIFSPPEIKDKILQASPLLQPPLPGRPPPVLSKVKAVAERAVIFSTPRSPLAGCTGSASSCLHTSALRQEAKQKQLSFSGSSGEPEQPGHEPNCGVPAVPAPSTPGG